jgi:hypothetical protein
MRTFPKKLAANDKALENIINIKLDSLSSSCKNQLSFTKMIETQLSQFAAVAPNSETGKIRGQPENVSAVSISWEPRYPNHAERPWLQGNNWDEPTIEEEGRSRLPSNHLFAVGLSCQASITTGKPEFAVRENLCRAFSFRCTVKSFFAVHFIQGARQRKSAW